MALAGAQHPGTLAPRTANVHTPQHESEKCAAIRTGRDGPADDCGRGWFCCQSGRFLRGVVPAISFLASLIRVLGTLSLAVCRGNRGSEI